jgi:hypothetical protein
MALVDLVVENPWTLNALLQIQSRANPLDRQIKKFKGLSFLWIKNDSKTKLVTKCFQNICIFGKAFNFLDHFCSMSFRRLLTIRHGKCRTVPTFQTSPEDG